MSFLPPSRIRFEHLVDVWSASNSFWLLLILSSSPTDDDVTEMYDEAFKKQPGNEELGAQAFMANAKISNWKIAQQVNISYYLISRNHVRHGFLIYKTRALLIPNTHDV